MIKVKIAVAFFGVHVIQVLLNLLPHPRFSLAFPVALDYFYHYYYYDIYSLA